MLQASAPWSSSGSPQRSTLTCSICLDNPHPNCRRLPVKLPAGTGPHLLLPLEIVLPCTLTNCTWSRLGTCNSVVYPADVHFYAERSCGCRYLHCAELPSLQE